jgi:type 1 glutamine amidotransferase
VTDRSLVYVTQAAPYASGPAGVHGVLDQSVRAMSQLAAWAGLQVLHVEDVTTLAPDVLAEARAVVLFTVGETPWSDTQKELLVGGIQSGRTSLVAVHTATDSCHGWDEYASLVGARFDGILVAQAIELEVIEHDHPATQHLGAAWVLLDEVFRFRDVRPDARVLLRIPPEQLEGDDHPAHGYPLSWCFAEGAGRVFSTSLGHFPTAWESTVYLRHLAGGLAWSLGVGT